MANATNSTSLWNTTTVLPTEEETTVATFAGEDIGKDDAAWILANAFLVLTMQTGFGMLEAGTVSEKNITNIMVKNVVDVSIGGITYWAVGYAISFSTPSNAFCGYGLEYLFATALNNYNRGSFYTHYVFQFSFATAATTIVSGAVAERMKLNPYMIYSSLNVFIYCIPASWAWHSTGYLFGKGFFDFAGAAVVHLNGGASALVAASMLGPRMGRFSENDKVGKMSSPVTALTGTFMLWWAWLSFNCGSSFGVDGEAWKIAAKVGVTTLNGSIGGSVAGLALSVVMTWKKGEYHYDVAYIMASVLGGLVGITACCAVITPTEAIIIGAIGGTIAVLMIPVMEHFKIDDPVGAVPVHMFAAIWSTLAVGLFGSDDFDLLGGNSGLFRGGGLYLLGVQLLGTIMIGSWSMVSTYLVLFGLKKTLGIRMDLEEEVLGADWVEHRIASENFASKLEVTLVDLKIDAEEADKIMEKVLSELKEGNRQVVNAGVRNYGGKKAEKDDLGAIEKRRMSMKENRLSLRRQTADDIREASRPGSVHTVHNGVNGHNHHQNGRYEATLAEATPVSASPLPPLHIHASHPEHPPAVINEL